MASGPVAAPPSPEDELAPIPIVVPASDENTELSGSGVPHTRHAVAGRGVSAPQLGQSMESATGEQIIALNRVHGSITEL